MAEGSSKRTPVPPWLNDEKEINQLLRWFVERYIKNSQRGEKPLRKTLKENFFPQNESGSQSWILLNKLAPALLTIKLKKNRPAYDVEWNGASVYIEQPCIQQLMDWLGYEIDDSLSVWQQDVDEYLTSDEPDNFELGFLKSRPVKFHGKTNVDVIQQLNLLAKETAVDKTLRELSAKYFWGDSKFLESLSADWLCKALPHLSVEDRKIQVNFFLPQYYDRVLFVENLDSYDQLMRKQPASIQHFAIVYASGFRLSAARIREVNGVSMHQSLISEGVCESFVNYWFDKNAAPMPCFFWGDFDFSAMGILKSLRSHFPTMQLWQPGYQAMKQQLDAGRGHTVSLRDKQAQNDPLITGCDYADNIILPMLRKCQFCYDQEGIDLSSI